MIVSSACYSVVAADDIRGARERGDRRVGGRRRQTADLGHAVHVRVEGEDVVVGVELPTSEHVGSPVEECALSVVLGFGQVRSGFDAVCV